MMMTQHFLYQRQQTEGADTTFDNKPSSGSFRAEATMGASLEMTAGPCTAIGATGAEGTFPSTVAKVSFNVSGVERQTNSFPTGKPWQAEKNYG